MEIIDIQSVAKLAHHHNALVIVDNIFGLNIYSAIHLNTNQPIYVTSTELYK